MLRINCIYILTSDLCFILLQQPACTSPSRVISQVEHHHALSLPADEGAIYHPFYHGQEVLIAVVACGNHRESRPIKLLQNFKNNLQLQASGAQELQVDGATLLKEQKMWDMEKRCNIVFCINRETSERTRGITDFLSSLNFLWMSVRSFRSVTYKPFVSVYLINQGFLFHPFSLCFLTHSAQYSHS